MKNNENNRVEKHLEAWKARNRNSPMSPVHHADKRLEFLEKMKKEAGAWPDQSVGEQKSMGQVNKEAAKMRKGLNPGILEKLFSRMHNPVANFLAGFLKGMRENTHFPRTGETISQVKQTVVAKHVPKKQEKGKTVMLPFSDTMQHLQRDLAVHGFGNRLDNDTLKAIRTGAPSLKVIRDITAGNDQKKYTLSYEKNAESGRYYAAQAEGRLRKDLFIDNNVAPGLEDRMKTIDWNKEYFTPGFVASADAAENKNLLESVNGIFKEMLALMTSGDHKARQTHDLLAYKYFADTPSEKIIANMPELKQRHEIRVRVNLNQLNSEAFSAQQLFHLMDQRAVKGMGLYDAPAQWFKVDAGPIDKNGYHPIKAIPGSERFNLEKALTESGVDEHLSKQRKQGLITLLEKDEKVEVPLLKNGVRTDRVVAADPAKSFISIDLEESQKRGLYHPDPPEARVHIEEYKNFQSKGAGAKIRTMEKEESLNYVHRPGRS